MKRSPIYSFLSLAAIAPAFVCAQSMIDFSDLNLSSPPTQAASGGVFYNGSDHAGGFTSGGVFFENTFTDFGGGFTGWSGWSYSTTTDATTPGFGNQYSAFPGSGDGDAVYAVSFGPVSIDFGTLVDVSSVSITNTTYAALSMTFGDSFSKQFGGIDGTDPDFFKLTIEGLDAVDVSTGTLEVFLADFRFVDSAQDFILDTWLVADLSSLGTVKSLNFSLSSTDNGSFGMNTPNYFALDNLSFTFIPEPSAFSLFGGLAAALFLIRRKR